MADEPIERLSMYGWYDPAHLLQTGIRVVIATVFGEFLDRRELFGNRDDPKPASLDPYHNYSVDSANSPRNEIWLDFVADTGDGWDPTYAVARLLARSNLAFREAKGQWRSTPPGAAVPGSITTDRGKILVFGGDEVYATASREGYHNRLVVPFEQAAKAEGAEKALEAADVYAIPGNHDWYDGLGAFLGLFGARRPGAAPDEFGGGRRIGSRRSKQTRSYFALKLPGNWWLLGVDAQLSGYIDRGQVAFFDDVAQSIMKPGSNIILCAAMPSWCYVGLDGSAEEMFRNHSFLERIVTGTAREEGVPKLHNLRLVLTGDSHHYARYIEGADNERRTAEVTEIAAGARCYITWGGGGAFLHPTHQLRDVSFEWDRPPPPPVKSKEIPGKETYQRSFKNRMLYPDAKASRCLSWRTLLFAWNNPKFALLMGVFAAIVTWALAGTAGLKDQHLPGSLRAAPDLWSAVGELFLLLTGFPWVLLTCVALIAALTYFSAAQRMWLRWVVGGLHFLAYFIGFFAIFLLVARYARLGTSPILSPVALVLIVSVITAVVAPTILGIYLWVSLTFFRRHWNEAFSSLRIKHHKGFLRLHIKDGALTVFPIALDDVPDGGDGTLDARLIERPIRISP